ncbi:hypothetical protein [Hyphomicrobium sp.]|uniref:hypothetical protein n=1 Tax=Hyphomicrobium sp. TaxID=82 RepID=UPI000FBDD876|nr:hypothetical protein [Hyphomicrobium sp.]RUP00051.1 MAG: hypothetical protein EKK30_02730 [Hyphomicrobium sp.]
MSLIHDAPGWVWCGLALAYIGVKSSFTSGGGIYGNIGDSDDLTRLIQVRELIAYGHWFDTTTLKMGGDGGMLSHWSRLIDLPLVLLIKLFSIFMPVEDAERVTHIVWPLLVLSCLLAAIYRCVQAVAGKLAACIALALVVLAPCDWYQFSVGRIDHHNVMIAATVSAALLMWSGPQRTTQWVLAGALTGLAFAVGYEALAPAVALGVLAAVWSLVDKSMSKPAAAFALALAAVFDLSFLATISPARWMDIHCDAISLNMVVLITAGAAALAVTAGPGQNWPMAARIAIIALFSAAGVVAFGALEPKCLAGPMGQLPPALKPIWLDKVAEAQSIFSRLFDGQLKDPLALLATFLIALATQWAEVRKARRPADVFLLAALAVFVVLACWQMKYISYAGCLAVVPVAIAISRLGATGNISATTVRATAVVLVSQSFLVLISGQIDRAFGKPQVLSETQIMDAGACSAPEHIRDLADLPPGLFASHIDMGAYIAGLTHHRVLSAPYHRIPNAIIANDAIFSAPGPAAAAGVLKAQHVDYVVICPGLDETPLSSTVGTFRTDLVNGHAPAYLVPVQLGNAHSIYRVWKVDRSALNLQLSKAAASGP